MQLSRRSETLVVAGGVLAILGVNSLLGSAESGAARRIASALGIVFLLGLALLFSENRRKIPLRTILVGLGLQAGLAVLVLRTPIGQPLFNAIGHVFAKIFEFSMAGASFVFGSEMSSPVGAVGFVFAVQIVSVIVFMGAVMRMLYHIGFMQLVVRGLAWTMRRTMRISGAESLAAASNVFAGMVESALTVRPYVAKMTRSELFTIMSAGMATVAGSVMALYVGTVSGFLGANAAGHLLTASLMSAPAAILIAKIMIPETETPETLDSGHLPTIDEGDERPTNLMDAAARGGTEGLQLALSVVALLIAFVGLVKAGNAVVSFASAQWLSFEELVGCCCWPIATGMGIPFDESIRVGVLIGQKTVANEFVAYQSLAEMMAVPGNALSPRTALMMSYGLCGFANLGSVAIMIAGIGGMAALQRSRLATLGLLSIVSGSLAAFMTACLAGLLG